MSGQTDGAKIIAVNDGLSCVLTQRRERLAVFQRIDDSVGDLFWEKKSTSRPLAAC